MGIGVSVCVVAPTTVTLRPSALSAPQPSMLPSYVTQTAPVVSKAGEESVVIAITTASAAQPSGRGACEAASYAASASLASRKEGASVRASVDASSVGFEAMHVPPTHNTVGPKHMSPSQQGSPAPPQLESAPRVPVESSPASPSATPPSALGVYVPHV